MTRKTVAYIIAAIICLASASCKKDNTIQYNNATMGNVVNGTFTSDQGNIFNVAEKNCEGLLDTMKRAFVVCDVLNKTDGGADNEYDIRLNALASVLTKNIVAVGAEANEEVYVEDPVHIEYLWISGGYINIYAIMPFKTGSKTAHMINLVQQPAEKEGQYILRLCHNAYGETMTETTSHEFVLGGGYVSFPIGSIIQEDEADLKIEWKWYQSTGAGLSQVTEYKHIEGTYKKDGYQHVPEDLTARTKAVLK